MFPRIRWKCNVFHPKVSTLNPLASKKLLRDIISRLKNIEKDAFIRKNGTKIKCCNLFLQLY